MKNKIKLVMFIGMISMMNLLVSCTQPTSVLEIVDEVTLKDKFVNAITNCFGLTSRNAISDDTESSLKTAIKPIVVEAKNDGIENDEIKESLKDAINEVIDIMVDDIVSENDNYDKLEVLQNFSDTDIDDVVSLKDDTKSSDEETTITEVLKEPQNTDLSDEKIENTTETPTEITEESIDETNELPTITEVYVNPTDNIDTPIEIITVDTTDGEDTMDKELIEDNGKIKITFNHYIMTLDSTKENVKYDFVESTEVEYEDALNGYSIESTFEDTEKLNLKYVKPITYINDVYDENFKFKTMSSTSTINSNSTINVYWKRANVVNCTLSYYLYNKNSIHYDYIKNNETETILTGTIVDLSNFDYANFNGDEYEEYGITKKIWKLAFDGKYYLSYSKTFNKYTEKDVIDDINVSISYGLDYYD